MLRWLVGCALALAGIAAPTAALAGKRVALVIGNNQYANMSRLYNAVQDAERIAALLAASGFEMVSCPGQKLGCYNASRERMLDALDSLRRAVKGADLVLVFYSGHGMEGAQGNVLAPVDMQFDCGDRQPRRQVLLKQLMESMADAPQSIVVLDACRNDPLPACPPARGFVPFGFGPISAPGGRMMLVSSTKAGQVAFDGVPGQHSPFARALIHWMEQAPTLYFNQLLVQVSNMVTKDTTGTRYTQMPQVVLDGGAHNDCLAGASCEGDARISELRAELKLLQEKHASDQEVVRTTEAFLDKIGVRSAGKRPSKDKPDAADSTAKGRVPASRPDDRGDKALKTLKEGDNRQGTFEGVVKAVRTLASRHDDRGDKALKTLKEGDNTQAAKLFAEELAASEKRARTAQGPQQAQLYADAARAARNLAAIERPTSAAKAAEYYKKSLAIDPDDAQTWYDLGETLRDAGRTADALDAFTKAADLAKSHDTIALGVRSLILKGDMVHRLSGTQAAQDVYASALLLATQGAEAHPGDLNLQRELVQAYFRIGDIQRSEGMSAEALVSFQTALAAAERLAATNPSNPQWQRDLSVAHNRMAAVHVQGKAFGDALESYRKGLAAIAPVAKADPGNGAWQREHSYSLNRIADILTEQGDLAGALKGYREAMAIRARLSNQNPTHLDWRSDLAFSHHLVGSVLLKQKQLQAARLEYEAQFEIMSRLARDHPEQRAWQRDLAFAHLEIGDVLLDQGNASGALNQYRNALKIREQLAQRELGDVQRQYDIALARWSVATALARQGARKQATAAYQQSRALLQECISRAPQFSLWSDDLAALNQELAEFSK